MSNVGGLNYTIRVEDKFSTVTKAFRSELHASRQEFRQFIVDMRALQRVASATRPRRSTSRGGASGASSADADAIKAARDLQKVRKLHFAELQAQLRTNKRLAAQRNSQDKFHFSEKKRRIKSNAALEKRLTTAQAARESRAATAQRRRTAKQGAAIREDLKRTAQIQRRNDKATRADARRIRAEMAEGLRWEREQRTINSRRLRSQLSAERADRARTARLTAADIRSNNRTHTEAIRENRARDQSARAMRAMEYAADREDIQRTAAIQLVADRAQSAARRMGIVELRAMRVEQLRIATAAAARAEAQRLHQAQQLLAQDHLQSRFRASQDAQARSARRRADIFNTMRADERRHAAATGRGGGRSDLDELNRVSFTFRRLIGILAVFQGIRVVASAFRSIVSDAIKLNAELETAQNGLAAILVSTSQIRDSSGRLLEGQEAFAAAVEISRDQIRKLRIDGLKTNATFAQLLKTMQSATAPGREAGLTPDQIRATTIRIAQAAAATGVPGDQLDEEVRSIISGTTTAKNTRLAQSVGGSKRFNEESRAAKELGRTSEFLEEKFESFAHAGEAALDTFDGALSNTKDAILLVTESGALNFFESLKDLFKEIQSQARIDNGKGSFLISPTAIAATRLLFDELAASTDEIREAFDFQTLAPILLTIGTSLRVTADTVIGLVEGVSAGLFIITNSFASINGILSLTNYGILEWESLLQSVVRTTAMLLTLSVAVSTAMWAGTKAWAVWGALPGPVKAIAALLVVMDMFKAITTFEMFGALEVSLTGVVSLLELTILGFRKLANELAGLTPFQSKSTTVSTRESLQQKTDAALASYPNKIAEVEARNREGTGGLQDRLTEALQALDIGTGKGVAQAIKDADKAVGGLDVSLFGIGKRLGDDVKAAEKLATSLQKAATALEKARAGLGSGLAGRISDLRRTSSQGQQASLAPAIKERNTATAVFTSSLSSPAQKADARQRILDTQQEILATHKKLQKVLNTEVQALLVQDTLTRRVSNTLDERKLSVSGLEATADGTTDFDTMERAHELESRRVALLQAEATFQDIVHANTTAELTMQLSLVTATAEVKEIEESILEVTRSRANAAEELAQAIAEVRKETRDTESGLNESILGDLGKLDEALLQAADGLDGIGDILGGADIGGGLDTIESLTEAMSTLGLTADQAADRLKNLQNMSNGDTFVITGGFMEAFSQMALELPTVFQLSIDLMKNIVKGFGDFVADTIVDAFDPTTDTDLQTRFARFLQGMAKTVISTLVQIATVKAVLGLASLLGGGLGGATGTTTQGGQVPTSFFAGIGGGAVTGAMITPYGPDPNYRQGYATGGEVTGIRRHHHARPKGLDQRDQIPIWTQAGEVVTQRPAVRYYGSRFMDALNHMKIPAAPLQAMVQGIAASSTKPPAPKKGYVTGGQVAAAPPTPSQGAVPGAPTQTFMVANDQAADRLLAGGRNAQLNWYRQNADQVKQALGIRRT